MRAPRPLLTLTILMIPPGILLDHLVYYVGYPEPSRVSQHPPLVCALSLSTSSPSRHAVGQSAPCRLLPAVVALATQILENIQTKNILNINIKY